MSEMPSNNLRGRIIGKYHSILNFSKVLHWSSRKTYDIVNGKQDPTGKDIEAICNALDVYIPDEMRSLFFTQ